MLSMTWGPIQGGDGNNRGRLFLRADGHGARWTFWMMGSSDRTHWTILGNRFLFLHSIQRTHTSLSNTGLEFDFHPPFTNFAHKILAFCPRPIPTALRPPVWTLRQPDHPRHRGRVLFGVTICPRERWTCGAERVGRCAWMVLITLMLRKHRS